MTDAILAQSGIYAITNTINGKRYIGSAVDIHRRYSDHVKRLRKNEHHSAALQRAWGKYGGKAFEISVLEVVKDRAALIAREQEWIDAEGPIGRNGYNMSPTAGSPLGVKHSPSAKLNMSNSASKRASDPLKIEKMRLINLGKRHSPESIEKMRLAKLGIKRPRAAIEKMMLSRSEWKPTPEHAEILRNS